jgi:hypothetical protein
VYTPTVAKGSGLAFPLSRTVPLSFPFCWAIRSGVGTKSATKKKRLRQKDFIGLEFGI